MAYKTIQSKNKPSEFNSGLKPVLYAPLTAFLFGDIKMKKVPLTKGFFALVDNEDYEQLILHKWQTNPTSYGSFCAIRSTRKPHKTIYMHRQIMEAPDHLDVDHKNHNTLDNRRCNLRLATRSQNLANRIKRKTLTSRHKGVYYETQTKKWLAGITVKGKYIYIGRYIKEADAAKAYDKKAKEMFGEFAYLNLKEK